MLLAGELFSWKPTQWQTKPTIWLCLPLSFYDQTWDSYLKPWFAFSGYSILMCMGYLLTEIWSLNLLFSFSWSKWLFALGCFPKTPESPFLGHTCLNSSFRINKYFSTFSHLMQYHTKKYIEYLHSYEYALYLSNTWLYPFSIWF